MAARRELDFSDTQALIRELERLRGEAYVRAGAWSLCRGSSKVIIREGRLQSSGATLLQRSVVPDEECRARLGLVHGYGDHSGRHMHFLRWMAERGVACHSFDFRGHGRSSGRRGYVRRWDEFMADLRAFLDSDSLRDKSQGPLVLLGHSHGAVVLAKGVLDGVAEAAGIILSSPYLSNRVPIPLWKSAAVGVANLCAPWCGIGTGVRGEWLTSDPEMIQERRGDPLALNIATPRWFSSMQPIQREVLARAAEFRAPLLMLIGGSDPVADPSVSEGFFRAAGSSDKTLRQYPHMVHEILRETGREAVFEEILSWVGERAGFAAVTPR